MNGDILSYFSKLKDNRTETDYFVAEGWTLTERVFDSRVEPLAVIAVPQAENRALSLANGRCPVTIVPEARISDIAGFKFHRGIMCAARKPDTSTLGDFIEKATSQKAKRVVILPHLTESENLGAIIRTCACFDIPILLGPKTGDPFSRLCLRASMGGSLRTEIYRYENDTETIETLRERSWDLVGTVLAPDAIPLVSFAWPVRCGIVFGNESEGTAEPWLQAIGHKVSIPMERGMDSLNVAVAAGIFVYDACKNT